MIPYGIDAKNYSRPGWGGGLHIVYGFEQTKNLLAGVAGIEYINLLSQSFESYDDVGGVMFPYRQETGQGYFRLYLGPELGPHGAGFFRPHAGLNIALIIYGIRTDVVVEDSNNPDNEISKNKFSDTKASFGYDLTAGLDLNFNNNVAVDIGMKYLKSFSVPQQLGSTDAITIYPQYFQIYLGIGVTLDYIASQKPDEN
jgi:opacity protein-like surface antigen